LAVTAAEHGQLLDQRVGPSDLLLWCARHGAQLLQGVDKVAAGTVRAKADTVIGATHVCLELGVAVNCAQLLLAVRKLAFLAVLADTVLLEGAAHLRLVPVAGLTLVLLL